MTDLPIETAPHADDLRPSRADATTTERRRRRGTESGVVQRLEIPAAIRDKPDFDKFVWRYINDTGNRIHRLTVQDDWEIVTAEGSALSGKQHEGRATSTAIRYQVDVGANNEPVYAYLCRKPRDFHEQDQDEKVRVTADTERAIEKAPPAEAQDDTSTAAKGNRVGRSVRRR